MRWFWATLVGLALLGGAQVAFSAERPIAAARWYSSLQTIGGKYKPGENALQNKQRREQLLAELSELKPAAVKMVARVKHVDFKDGVARIFTTSLLPERKPGSPEPALRLDTVFPLEFTADEKTTAGFKVGEQVIVEATLEFQADKYGDVGYRESLQQFHTVSHDRISPGPLGTYTSSNCQITIGGKEYPSRWNKK